MRSLVQIANVKPWSDMSREEQALALHQLEKQMSALANQLALDVTSELHRSGVPCHFEVTFKMVVQGTDPRHDA